MIDKNEVLHIQDAYGFHYEVTIEHLPNFGYSNATHAGTIVAQVEKNKLHEPISDNDQEWERYDELFAEWKDAVISDMKRICTEYFNDY